MNTARALAKPGDSIPTRKSLLDRLRSWPGKPDDESWREFFNIYWRLVYFDARRAGLSEDEAQEVVQRTIISVAGSLARFKYEPGRIGEAAPGTEGSRSSFKTWLRAIVRHRISDVMQKRIKEQQRTVPLPEDSSPDAAWKQVVDPTSLDPDARWDQEYELALIEAALARVRKRAKAAHLQIFSHHVIEGHAAQDSCKHFRVGRSALYLITHRVGKLMKTEVARLREKLI